MPTVASAVRSDEGLASELRLAVMRLRRRLVAERDPANELSLSQMSVLGSLYRLGELSIGELAAHERVQPPSMTRTVSCLEERGHVLRRPHASDGRQVLVSLSDLGRRTLLADRERRDLWLAQRLTELTHEQRAVLRQAVPVLAGLADTE
ncbi:MAG TPA: MarR family transcriptional regulator [Nocardioides sp.]|uniref:MarR family winged helix-turn-helix transcriptional regulator n=1 Tax=Nocardioides sp. TaxID=35761 RepID=UPI002C19CF2C|nr:MarR family transcriptional regulator [Nocardioides sp.]HQR26662.1 MarR family transcriptional regulator [Nocardioides sp.]